LKKVGYNQLGKKKEKKERTNSDKDKNKKMSTSTCGGWERKIVPLGVIKFKEAKRIRDAVIKQHHSFKDRRGRALSRNNQSAVISIDSTGDPENFYLVLPRFPLVGRFPIPAEETGADHDHAPMVVEIVPPWAPDRILKLKLDDPPDLSDPGVKHDVELCWETVLAMDDFVVSRGGATNVLYAEDPLAVHEIDLDDELWHSTTVLRNALLRHVSRCFARAAVRVVEEGLPQTFEEHTDALDVLRGRPNFKEQMNKGAGLEFPVYCTFFALSADNRANRALRAAARVLGQAIAAARDEDEAPGTSVGLWDQCEVMDGWPVLEALEWVYTELGQVADDEEPDPPLTIAEVDGDEGCALDQNYFDALRWAAIALSRLRNVMPSADNPRVTLPGFAVCLDKLAEHWIGYQLMRYFEEHPELGLAAEYSSVDKGGTVNLSAEGDGRNAKITCNPDYMVRDASTSRIRLVVDFKNKASASVLNDHDGAMDCWRREDLQQINAFADAAGAPGLVVYSPKARNIGSGGLGGKAKTRRVKRYGKRGGEKLLGVHAMKEFDEDNIERLIATIKEML
jgi:hypothetical protein